MLLLLKEWENQEDRFSNVQHKKKQVWADIGKTLRESGFKYTDTQVESKWKNLTKKYRDTVDHNSTSGSDRKTCSYYSELSQIYGYKPNVNPLCTISEEADDFGAVSENQDPPPKKKEKAKRKRRHSSSDLISTVKSIHEEQKDMEAQRMKVAKEMHDEKMALFSRLVDCLCNEK